MLNSLNCLCFLKKFSYNTCQEKLVEIIKIKEVKIKSPIFGGKATRLNFPLEYINSGSR